MKLLHTWCSSVIKSKTIVGESRRAGRQVLLGVTYLRSTARPTRGGGWGKEGNRVGRALHVADSNASVTGNTCTLPVACVVSKFLWRQVESGVVLLFQIIPCLSVLYHPPPPTSDKRKVTGGCFCLQSLPKRECEVPSLAVGEKVSWCSVLLGGVQCCRSCAQKTPHYEDFRLWIVCLGPVSRVAQIPEISPGRINFCTISLASWNFDIAAIFFGGGGEFLHLFRCEGASTLNCVVHYLRVFLTPSMVIDFREGANRKEWWGPSVSISSPVFHDVRD